MIRHLQHSEIDKTKWDECVNISPGKLVYAYSWYLDIVSPGWEALVLDDYLAVMPLTCRKKYGLNYLYQPPFTQQLGVFGPKLNERIIQHFLDQVPILYKLVEINLNIANSGDLRGYETSGWLTHHLSLNKKHEELMQTYSTNHKRNLRKAVNSGYETEKNTRMEEIIRLFRSGKGKEADSLKRKDYKVLIALAEACIKKNKAERIGVRNKEGILLAGALFIVSDGKAIFLFSGTSPAARNTGALHFLIDSFIREYSGSDLTLDFEGSNDKELARFYKGFGASEFVYLHLRRNDLPAMIRWLKK